MTKQEFNKIRVGDVVYPDAGQLEGHAFEVVKIVENKITARLMREYVLTWQADKRTQCIRTYEEGYTKTMVYSHWRTPKQIRFWW